MSHLVDLGWSAVALFVFWVARAAMSRAIEGWSFGNAVYALVILTLTIGQSVAASLSHLVLVEPPCQPSADQLLIRLRHSEQLCTTLTRFAWGFPFFASVPGFPISTTLSSF
jgi:hypothetical protein